MFFTPLLGSVLHSGRHLRLTHSLLYNFWDQDRSGLLHNELYLSNFTHCNKIECQYSLHILSTTPIYSDKPSIPRRKSPIYCLFSSIYSLDLNHSQKTRLPRLLLSFISCTPSIYRLIPLYLSLFSSDSINIVQLSHILAWYRDNTKLSQLGSISRVHLSLPSSRTHEHLRHIADSKLKNSPAIEEDACGVFAASRCHMPYFNSEWALPRTLFMKLFPHLLETILMVPMPLNSDPCSSSLVFSHSNPVSPRLEFLSSRDRLQCLTPMIGK